MNKRVVVTGLGAVTPIGCDMETIWNNLLNGVSGVGMLTKIDVSKMPVKVGAEVKDFDIEKYINFKEARRMDLFTQYAVGAACDAVEDSGLEITEENANRVGVWIGSGIGGIGTIEKNHLSYLEKGYRRVSPFFIPMIIPDMASGQVSIKLGAKGPNSCSVTACASGTNSIGDAFKVIQRGQADVMVTGGTEAPMTEMAIAGFTVNTALSQNPDPKTASRPFDKNRDGFVIAEGAGIIILEELEHAKARGAKIYAEIVGYGTTGDAFHITAPAPDGEGGARAMQMAIEDSGCELSEIGYLNAHGTSTPYNDKYETAAIKSVFGEYAQDLAISSTKSMTGHLLGAAGGVEAIFAVKTIQEGKIPPTINLEEADPECDLNYVPNKAIEKEITYAMSNSLGFGGHNAAIIFKKFEE